MPLAAKILDDHAYEKLTFSSQNEILRNENEILWHFSEIEDRFGEIQVRFGEIQVRFGEIQVRFSEIIVDFFRFTCYNVNEKSLRRLFYGIYD